MDADPALTGFRNRNHVPNSNHYSHLESEYGYMAHRKQDLDQGWKPGLQVDITWIRQSRQSGSGINSKKNEFDQIKIILCLRQNVWNNIPLMLLWCKEILQEKFDFRINLRSSD